MKKHHTRAVTLPEVLIVVAILALAGILMAGGSRIYLALQKQWVLYKIQREAQGIQYAISKDIRNAKYIIDIQPTKLTLRAMNFREYGYDGSAAWALNPFNPVNIGTITYRYIPAGFVAGQPGAADVAIATQPAHVLHRTVFNNNVRDRKLLLGLLSNGETTDINRILFSTYPAGATLIPPRAARTHFEFGRGFWKTSPRIYEDHAWVRTGEDAQREP